MEFIILDSRLKKEYRQELLEIVRACDNDFIPPLSRRTSTTQKELLIGDLNGEGVLNYFNQMIEQNILCTIKDDKIIGFVSYKENYASEEIPVEFLPNIYISTVMIEPNNRGRKLTSIMYEYLFNTLYPGRNFCTRTWSTNFAHIKILTNFGFERLKVIKNDRGEGIDTIYYIKKNI